MEIFALKHLFTVGGVEECEGPEAFLEWHRKASEFGEETGNFKTASQMVRSAHATHL